MRSQTEIISRKPRVGNLADMVKIATIFIEKTFKTQKKLKELQNISVFLSVISVFLDVLKVADFW